MKAVGYQQPQPIEKQDSLIDIELPKPVATERDLLVKVNAISVNPVDTKIRAKAKPNEGEYKVLGWDAVGEVVAVGDNTEFYSVGDKVWYAGDITRPGANAEFHLVDERIVGSKPNSLSDAEAAAIPLTAITAWELLFDRLEFDYTTTPNKSSSQRVLIVGAAGGVGSILVQLAAKLTNATVIGTASRESSQEWVKNLGADYVINHYEPLNDELKRIGVNNVTHVISLTHTDQHYDQLVDALTPQGKFALIDDPKTNLDIKKLKTKSLSLHWELMFTRSMFNTDDMGKQRDLLNTVASLIDAGTIKTTFGEHYGLINAENLKRAHTHIETGKAIGKVVLEGF